MAVILFREDCNPLSCFWILPPQDSSTSSVGPVSKLAQDQELSKRLWLFSGTTALLLLHSCLYLAVVAHREPCCLSHLLSFIPVKQAPLTAPLTSLIITGHVFHWHLLIKTCPLLHKSSLVPIGGNESRAGPPFLHHQHWPAEGHNHQTS